MSIDLTNAQLGELRDASADFLGQQVVFNNLTLLGSGSVKDITLETRDDSKLLIAEVQLYTHLKSDTTYHDRFHVDGNKRVIERSQNEVFAFLGQGASPAVSITLQDEGNAIAKITRVFNHQGDKISWKRALLDMGVDESQLPEFVNIMDGIALGGSRSRFRLSNVLDEVEYSMKENTNDHENFDGTLRVTPSGKKQLLATLG
jgi:hypothetical protein